MDINTQQVYNRAKKVATDQYKKLQVEGIGQESIKIRLRLFLYIYYPELTEDYRFIIIEELQSK